MKEYLKIVAHTSIIVGGLTVMLVLQWGALTGYGPVLDPFTVHRNVRIACLVAEILWIIFGTSALAWYVFRRI